MTNIGSKLVLVLISIIVLGFSNNFVFSQPEIPFLVSASISPLAHLVAAVGGERVEVNLIIPPGADPHFFEFSPSLLQKISRSRAVFIIGLGLETFIEPMIATVKSEVPVFEVNPGIEVIQNTHPNPHIWLSPKNIPLIVQNIAHGLTSIDSAGERYYKSQAEKIAQAFQQLDQWFTQEVASLSTLDFCASHPAWSYLARDYGLNQVATLEEGHGKDPTPRRLKEIIDLMRAKKVRVILVSPLESDKVARIVAQETGATILYLDPIGQFPAGSYLDLMRENLQKIVEVLK